ncbi:MAG: hypothetical protein K0S78_1017 [Thermomicrobiales bacterium]|jgi:hypothetical protein|nr:hypothetical protein [Thermomicrobiales bacterium]MDF3038703.1 hypothetical protein [Thermomicrobiales bacterium]
MTERDEPTRPEENGIGPQNDIARARETLAPVRDALERAGFYAYGTIDAENRWVVSADDEAGHVDVRVGPDGYQLDLWGTIPGLFSEEESDYRRRAMERLARMTIPRVQQGFLAPNQAAWWDDTEGGPAARVRYELPFTAAAQTGAFAREHLPELEKLLDFIATQVST